MPSAIFLIPVFRQNAPGYILRKFSVMTLCLMFLLNQNSLIQANENSIQQYLQLISRYPSLIQYPGDASKGEIQIVLDPIKMAAIEKKLGRDVGVVSQDKYWLWINDACIFPSGYEGVYGRILWVNSLESTETFKPGVVFLPIMPDGKIVLNCNFRHATRSWEIELPRGGINKGEDLQTAARREVEEETGMIIETLFLLGEIPPDSGLTSTIAPIFAANVIKQKNAKQEESEAIEETLYLSLDEIKQAFSFGHHLCVIRGVEKKVFFRDPFLAYAILMYELKLKSKTAAS